VGHFYVNLMFVGTILRCWLRSRLGNDSRQYSGNENAGKAIGSDFNQTYRKIDATEEVAIHGKKRKRSSSGTFLCRFLVLSRCATLGHFAERYHVVFKTPMLNLYCLSRSL